MSVVSQPHLELVRSRKALEKAYVSQDWISLKSVDTQHGSALNAAFEDDQRNTGELVHEMERILHLYTNIVASLPTEMPDALSAFPHLQS